VYVYRHRCYHLGRSTSSNDSGRTCNERTALAMDNASNFSKAIAILPFGPVIMTGLIIF